MKRKILSLIFLFAMLFSIFSLSNDSLIYDTKCENCYAKLNTGTTYDENITNIRKVEINSRVVELFFPKNKESERKKLIVGGQVFGVKIKSNHLTVKDRKEQKDLKDGDKILKIDNLELNNEEELLNYIKNVDKDEVSITVLRKNEKIELAVPLLSNGTEKSLGITVASGVAGIGTVTYIDPSTGEFAGLGHGICEKNNDEPMEMKCGTVCSVVLGGIQKGREGVPGELSGILTSINIGSVKLNTPYGLFGKIDAIPENSEVLEIARRDEVKEGTATILSTLKNGKTQKYKIKIFNIDHSSHGTKCFKIKVEDPTLIAMSGGIVRGMSGSPIIQNGRIIGAVTHVMVNEPTVGYGIFIENMLSNSK